MSPERWSQVQALFEAAVEQPEAARAAYLDAACSDPGLRADVERLLRADAASGPLDAMQGEVAALTQAWRPVNTDTARFGPYQIVRLLGAGGMGAVYLAARADGGFEQEAALKLLPAIATPDRARRFRAERQMLARLAHPGIARLLDGGVTPDGQPWFAMEFVEGEPITQYCSRKALPLRDRLRLMLDVCAAVDFAHQNLIVHRDLKPSNILVHDGPDGPQVKLLDFGIAKLLAEPEDDALTRTEQRLLTPDYAAPEQVRGETLTTATDVYALGVLLYELLTGQRPYDVRGLPPTQLERVVCEQVPPRPSRVAKRNDSDAPALGPLPADLDVIVMTCLEKEPGRRYSSAALLRRDLQRFLEGRTIFARPPSPAYQLRTFVGRNRVLAGATALVLLALLGGLVTTRWQARRATAQAERAEAEARKAQQVSAFLLDVFRVADPDEALGDTITAREILDAGARRIREELNDQPEVQASVLDVIGQVYENLGLFERADSLLTQAHVLRHTTLGPTHPDAIQSTRRLAALRRLQGRFTDADSLNGRAIAALEATDAAFADLADAYSAWALVRQQLGAYPASDSLYQRALDYWRRLPERDSLALVTTKLHYGSLLSLMGRYTEAEPLYREAVRVRTAHYGTNHPETANAENNYAVFLAEAGQMEEAERRYRRVLAIRRSVYGADHPDVANTMNNLASLLSGVGRYAEAESLYTHTLAIHTTRYGDTHPEVSYVLGNLGFLYFRQQRMPEARRAFEQALAIQRRVFGDHHFDVGLTRTNLAWVYRAEGDWARAEAEYRATMVLFHDLVGENSLHTNVARASLASLLEDQDRLAEAESLYRAAISALAAGFPEGHPTLALNRSRLGGLLVRRGAAHDAIPFLRAALDYQETAFEPGHPALLTTYRRLADALIAERAFDEAEQVLREAERRFAATEERDPELEGELRASRTALQQGLAGQ